MDFWNTNKNFKNIKIFFYKSQNSGCSLIKVEIWENLNASRYGSIFQAMTHHFGKSKLNSHIWLNVVVK